MKAFTDIEQSKKLAEILPLESADFFWIIGHLHTDGPRYAIIRPRNEVSEVEKYWPCWSLAALRSLLPCGIKVNGELHLFESHNTFDEAWVYQYVLGDSTVFYFKAKYEIDACYEMILKLHKEGLL